MTVATDEDFRFVSPIQAPKAGRVDYDGKRHLEGCFHLRQHPETVREATAAEMATFRICFPCAKRVNFPIPDCR